MKNKINYFDGCLPKENYNWHIDISRKADYVYHWPDNKGRLFGSIANWYYIITCMKGE